MANIIGTEGVDTLTGTGTDDTIQGLGGNDRIIGTTGYDTVDGGAGTDKIDFSSINKRLNLASTGKRIVSDIYSNTPNTDLVSDNLNNIETIIGNPNQSNSISDFSEFGKPNGRIDVDLAANRLTFYDKDGSTPQTFTVKNFDNINTTNGNNLLAGNDRDNEIFAGAGNNVIFGSKGNDTLTASPYGNTTLDYSNLRRAVKIVSSGSFFSSRYGSGFSISTAIDKNGFGLDRSYGIKKVIGTINKANTIDASTAGSLASIDVNLATNLLKINAPADYSGTYVAGSNQFEVVNFVNAIGSKYSDNIVGANKNSQLTGGGGSDRIIGGNKNDRITGTDSTARGVGEIDTLTGGGGRDKFILGDKDGAYYLGNGNNDYATITDFDPFKDSISIGSLKNYSFALEGAKTIDLFSGKDVNTRDLIAKIQLSGGISSVGSNSRSVMGADASLNAIVSQLNIGSES